MIFIYFLIKVVVKLEIVVAWNRNARLSKKKLKAYLKLLHPLGNFGMLFESNFHC